MIFMTTRSSRFFVVLVHLVGVSTHLPSSFQNTGIVGVNPFSIVLESYSDPRQALLSQLQVGGDNTDESQQQQQFQPHWLQDSFDQTCLDPMGGFSECGDATLWLVIPKQRRHGSRRSKWIRWATEEEDELDEGYYALQLVDDTQSYLQQSNDDSNNNINTNNGGANDNTSSSSSTASSSSFWSFWPTSSSSATTTSSQSSSTDWAKQECLSRQKRDNKLVLVKCSQDRAWNWQFNEHGILHYEKPRRFGKPTTTTSASQRQLQKKKMAKQKSLECVGRRDGKGVILGCDGETPQLDLKSDKEERVVQVVLVRQATTFYSSLAATTATPPPTPPSSTTTSKERSVYGSSSTTAIGASTRIQQPEDNDYTVSNRPPTRIDIAHSHASTTATSSTEQHNIELKHSPWLTSLTSHKMSSSSSSSSLLSREAQPLPPLEYFRDTNPILLAGNRGLASVRSGESRSTIMVGNNNKNKLHETSSPSSSPSSPQQSQPSTTTTATTTHSSSPTIIKPMIRKIQMNPYIATSKEERWTDPQTGLVYRTDLCEYLGHERKDAGRHTLVGVGQYLKTVFNIKVYGIAYYVSKRDVLADPAMEPYARLTSEELRQRPDFFEVLRHMTPSSEPNAGTFDRTVFLKTNMQLATDTMRNSLEADWKFLTPEAKELLIGASMKSRPASPAMLEVIRSSDNPSRCSCSQIAPEEYQADPDCCARGTELVFTWRKNGNVEVRLNGDMIDSFPRPDIAAAIFYEYLRTDDPMSFDFLDRVVDGFPMLLGPLTQVKGITSAALSPAITHSTPGPAHKPSNQGSNPVLKALEGVGGALFSHANNFAGFVQNGASELGNNAMNSVRSVGDAARNLGEEVERRRDLISKHVSQFAHQTMSSFYGKDQKAVATVLPHWLESMGSFDVPLASVVEEANNEIDAHPRGRIFRNPLNRIFGIPEPNSPSAPDEIVPMIHPTTNSTQRLFLGVVHLYLLLMLIVSFPAHLTTTRTKMIVTRKVTVSMLSDSDNSDSDGSSDCVLTPPDHVKVSESSKAPATNGQTSSFRRFRRQQRHVDEEIMVRRKNGKLKKSLGYIL